MDYTCLRISAANRRVRFKIKFGSDIRPAVSIDSTIDGNVRSNRDEYSYRQQAMPK